MTLEKFTNYDDNELAEIKKIIHEYFMSLKTTFAPAMDLFTSETIERHANKFLLEKKAEYLLDMKAIADGFESEADRQFQIAQKAAEEAATAKAKADALAKAQKDEETRILNEEIVRQKVLQDLRDKEDAEAAAKLKAELKAKSYGENAVGI
jgi:hypothetical protein